MNQVSSLAEHSDALLGLFGAAIIIISWFLRANYKSLTEKLDRVEACLNDVKRGYVRLKDCDSQRSSCQGYGKECTERILRVLERVEKNTDRNFSMIFYLADGLVQKKILDGEDLTKLRDKLEISGK